MSVDIVETRGLPIPRSAAPKISLMPNMKYVLDIITIFCLAKAITAGLSDIIDASCGEHMADNAPKDAPIATVIIIPRHIDCVALFIFPAPMFWLTYGITAIEVATLI